MGERLELQGNDGSLLMIAQIDAHAVCVQAYDPARNLQATKNLETPDVTTVMRYVALIHWMHPGASAQILMHEVPFLERGL